MLMRAARLVLDVGIHHFGWSREKARELANERLLGYGSFEVDRYSAIPAQALSYKIGELRLLALRHKAQTALGKRFDLRAFHTVILGHGALPLDVLERQVDTWIAEQRQKKERQL